MEQDIFNKLDSQEDLFNNAVKKELPSDKVKKNNSLWDRLDFTPVPVDTKVLDYSGKYFSFDMMDNRDIIPDECKDRIIELFTMLANAGYTYRCGLSSRDPMYKELTSIPNLKIEYYLGWGGRNSDKYNEATLVSPTERAYEHAANLSKIFLTNMSSIGRCMEANKLHCYLGKELNNPVKVMVVYNKTGDEKNKFVKSGEKRTVGSLYTTFRVAKLVNALVLNVKNANCVTRLKENLEASKE